MPNLAQAIEARHPWNERADDLLTAYVRELNGRGLRVTALSLRSEYLPKTGIRVLVEPAEKPEQTVEHRDDIRTDDDLSAAVAAYNGRGIRIVSFAIKNWGEPCMSFILERV